MKRDSRKECSNGGICDVPNVANVHSSMIGEIENRSSHLLAVDERAASTAFGQVCEPYHSWAVRTAVSVGMYTLLNREQLLQKLNETDGSSLKCLGGLIARH